MTTFGAGASGIIGKSVHRVRDDRLLRGRGRFVDDLDESGVLHAAVVRSPVARGSLRSFDADGARSITGVVAVLGPEELEAECFPVPIESPLPDQTLTTWDIISRDVRYVGQPVGVAIATSRALAEDAVEAVDLLFDEQEAVASVSGAKAAGARLVYPNLGSNLAGSARFGSSPEDVEKVFSTAPHVVARSYRIPRIVHNSLEGRGVVVEWDWARHQMTVYSSTHVPHLARQELACALGLRLDEVRVVASDIGGSFGLKVSLFPDEAIVALGAKILGRRVKWIEDRSEALTAGYQGRGSECVARIAIDDDGNFLAIESEIDGDIGGVCASGTGGGGPFQVAGVMVEGPYRFAAAGATLRAWYTNRPPTTAYRGYGMQEAAWMRERLVDEAARILAIDPVALRKRNMVRSDEMPFTTKTGIQFDSGDYAACLDRVCSDSVIHAEPARVDAGIRRGVGIASMVELTAYAPSELLKAMNSRLNGWESSTVRVNQDGSVTVFSGATSVGQGLETTLTQIAADRLGVPMAWIEVRLGDTETAGVSLIGSQASRATPLAGGALWKAAETLRERMYLIAAKCLGVEIDTVSFDRDSGMFRDGEGTTIAWSDVAARGWYGWEKSKSDLIRLEETVDFDPPGVAVSYATHKAVVRVELATGRVTVEQYWVADDAGTIVNPLLAAGQVVGGVAMGLGGALFEEATFDANGQPTSSTFLDYHLPVSSDVPDISLDVSETPSPFIPGGFKGLGESGIVLPAAVVGNAVANAVPEIADRLTELPMTPHRIWRLLSDAGLSET